MRCRTASFVTPRTLRVLTPGTSGLSSLKQCRLPERGARIARREEGEYRLYLTDEQRREPGCPARQAVLLQRGQATSM